MLAFCSLEIGTGVATASSEMSRSSSSAIATVEAAYDLETAEADWLPKVLEASRDLCDTGLGYGGLVGTKSLNPEPDEIPTIHQMYTLAGPPDFLMRHGMATAEIPPKQVHEQTQTGLFLASELMTPEQLQTWQRHIGFARDAIGIIALDTDGRGIHLLAPLAEVGSVRPAQRQRFSMLAAHLSAGLRLRRSVSEVTPVTQSETDALPLGAEAVVNPSGFEITDVAGGVRDRKSLEALRKAAVRSDQARGRLRREDPDAALAIWEALVRGRWSMIDWFDTDDRRYTLAVPNPPNVADPRMLTERESQVAAYAALGESHKMIAYRLGISRSTVSHALSSVRRKLGAKTHFQLVQRLSSFQQRPPRE